MASTSSYSSTTPTFFDCYTIALVALTLAFFALAMYHCNSTNLRPPVPPPLCRSYQPVSVTRHVSYAGS